MSTNSLLSIITPMMLIIGIIFASSLFLSTGNRANAFTKLFLPAPATRVNTTNTTITTNPPLNSTNTTSASNQQPSIQPLGPITTISINVDACNPNNQNPLSQKSVTIPVGGAINWTNNDNAYHEFLFSGPNALTSTFGSGLMAPGKTSSEITFKNPGTFSYVERFCNNLVGTINVVPSNQVQQQAINSKPLNSTLPRPLPLPLSSQQLHNGTLPRQLIGPQSQLTNSTMPSQPNATLPNQLPQPPSKQPNSTLPAIKATSQSQQPTATTTPPTPGFLSKGTINSLINAPTASWIASGNWIMNVDNGNVTFFDTNMTWFNNNGKTSHTHEFRNFKGGVITVEQPTKDIFLKGVMDVGTNHRIVWKNVPTTVSIHGDKTITISVDDNATNHHFAMQPVLGLVNSFVPCSDVPGANMEVLPSCS